MPPKKSSAQPPPTAGKAPPQPQKGKSTQPKSAPSSQKQQQQQPSSSSAPSERKNAKQQTSGADASLAVAIGGGSGGGGKSKKGTAPNKKPTPMNPIQSLQSQPSAAAAFGGGGFGGSGGPPLQGLGLALRTIRSDAPIAPLAPIAIDLNQPPLQYFEAFTEAETARATAAVVATVGHGAWEVASGSVNVGNIGKGVAAAAQHSSTAVGLGDGAGAMASALEALLAKNTSITVTAAAAIDSAAALASASAQPPSSSSAPRRGEPIVWDWTNRFPSGHPAATANNKNKKKKSHRDADDSGSDASEESFGRGVAARGGPLPPRGGLGGMGMGGDNASVDDLLDLIEEFWANMDEGYASGPTDDGGASPSSPLGFVGQHLNVDPYSHRRQQQPPLPAVGGQSAFAGVSSVPAAAFFGGSINSFGGGGPFLDGDGFSAGFGGRERSANWGDNASDEGGATPHAFTFGDLAGAMAGLDSPIPDSFFAGGGLPAAAATVRKGTWGSAVSECPTSQRNSAATTPCKGMCGTCSPLSSAAGGESPPMSLPRQRSPSRRPTSADVDVSAAPPAPLHFPRDEAVFSFVDDRGSSDPNSNNAQQHASTSSSYVVPDVVATVHSIKKLILAPHTPERPLALLAHRVGPMLLLEGTGADEASGGGGSASPLSGEEARKRALQNKLLYYSVMMSQGQGAGGEVTSATAAAADAVRASEVPEARRTFVAPPPLPPVPTDVAPLAGAADSEATPLPLRTEGGGAEPTAAPSGGPSPSSGGNNTNVNSSSAFRKALQWNLSDMNVLIGSTQPTLRDPACGEEVNLQMHDVRLLKASGGSEQQQPTAAGATAAPTASAVTFGGDAFVRTPSTALVPASTTAVAAPIIDAQQGSSSGSVPQPPLPPLVGPLPTDAKLDQPSALEYWLDNILSNVASVALCYHRDGDVQGYQVVPTHQLPQLAHPAFSPVAVQASSTRVLRWLKEGTSTGGTSFVVVKDANATELKLYDITGLSSGGVADMLRHPDSRSRHRVGTPPPSPAAAIDAAAATDGASSSKRLRTPSTALITNANKNNAKGSAASSKSDAAAAGAGKKGSAEAEKDKGGDAKESGKSSTTTVSAPPLDSTTGALVPVYDRNSAASSSYDRGTAALTRFVRGYKAALAEGAAASRGDAAAAVPIPSSAAFRHLRHPYAMMCFRMAQCLPPMSREAFKLWQHVAALLSPKDEEALFPLAAAHVAMMEHHMAGGGGGGGMGENGAPAAAADADRQAITNASRAVQCLHILDRCVKQAVLPPSVLEAAASFGGASATPKARARKQKQKQKQRELERSSSGSGSSPTAVEPPAAGFGASVPAPVTEEGLAHMLEEALQTSDADVAQTVLQMRGLCVRVVGAMLTMGERELALAKSSPNHAPPNPVSAANNPQLHASAPADPSSESEAAKTRPPPAVVLGRVVENILVAQSALMLRAYEVPSGLIMANPDTISAASDASSRNISTLHGEACSTLSRPSGCDASASGHSTGGEGGGSGSAATSVTAGYASSTPRSCAESAPSPPMTPTLSDLDSDGPDGSSGSGSGPRSGPFAAAGGTPAPASLSQNAFTRREQTVLRCFERIATLAGDVVSAHLQQVLEEATMDAHKERLQMEAAAAAAASSATSAASPASPINANETNLHKYVSKLNRDLKVTFSVLEGIASADPSFGGSGSGGGGGADSMSDAIGSGSSSYNNRPSSSAIIGASVPDHVNFVGRMAPLDANPIAAAETAISLYQQAIGHRHALLVSATGGSEGTSGRRSKGRGAAAAAALAAANALNRKVAAIHAVVAEFYARGLTTRLVPRDGAALLALSSPSAPSFSDSSGAMAVLSAASTSASSIGGGGAAAADSALMGPLRDSQEAFVHFERAATSFVHCKDFANAALNLLNASKMALRAGQALVALKKIRDLTSASRSAREVAAAEAEDNAAIEAENRRALSVLERAEQLPKGGSVGVPGGIVDSVREFLFSVYVYAFNCEMQRLMRAASAVAEYNAANPSAPLSADAAAASPSASSSAGTDPSRSVGGGSYAGPLPPPLVTAAHLSALHDRFLSPALRLPRRLVHRMPPETQCSMEARVLSLMIGLYWLAHPSPSPTVPSLHMTTVDRVVCIRFAKTRLRQFWTNYVAGSLSTVNPNVPKSLWKEAAGVVQKMVACDLFLFNHASISPPPPSSSSSPSASTSAAACDDLSLPVVTGGAAAAEGIAASSASSATAASSMSAAEAIFNERVHCVERAFTSIVDWRRWLRMAELGYVAAELQQQPAAASSAAAASSGKKGNAAPASGRGAAATGKKGGRGGAASPDSKLLSGALIQRAPAAELAEAALPIAKHLTTTLLALRKLIEEQNGGSGGGGGGAAGGQIATTAASLKVYIMQSLAVGTRDDVAVAHSGRSDKERMEWFAQLGRCIDDAEKIFNGRRTR